tara:strand:+ start:462 stop:773 length:312 start_codon:yes stop_codon:yes gene_type:complete
MKYKLEDGNNRYNNKSSIDSSASAEDILVSDSYINNREKIADVENRTFILCFLDMLAGGNGDMARKDFLSDSPIPSADEIKELLDEINEARMEVIADWFDSVS